MLKNTVCLAALSALLAAPGAGAVELYPVSPDAQRITLTLPEAGQTQTPTQTQTHIQYTGFWHREDYALFQSAQFRSEIIYAAADPHENAALEISLPFARARDSFDINANGALDPGGMGRLDQPRRTVFYQPYALRDRGWVCVAVKSEWNHVGRDPRNRPARAMFGYICDKRGGTMTQARAAELARSIETSGAEVAWKGHGPAISGSAPVGNSRFPFGFGVHFNDHDGDARGG